MAITLDAATISSSNSSPANPYTFSHTVAAGATVLYVLLGSRAATAPPTAVTYNGVSMTRVRAETTAPMDSSIWRLDSPATGANTVSITFPAAASGVSVLAVSLFGAATGAPDAHNGATAGTGTSSTVQVTSVANNCWLLSVLTVRDQTGQAITQGAESGRTNWSPDWEYEPGSILVVGGTKYQDVSPAATKDFSWTWTDSRAWCHSAVSIAPAADPFKHMQPAMMSDGAMLRF